MSTAVKNKPMTAIQRRDQATQQASEMLGLDDLKAMGAALAEAALEGIRRNPSFAAHVKHLYLELCAKPKSQSKRTSPTRTRRASPDVELVPRKHIEGREANPAAPPDPYFLLELYEADQLALALARYKKPDLLLAAETVRQRTPNIRKLPKKATSNDIIDYIVEHVAGAGR